MLPRLHRCKHTPTHRKKHQHTNRIPIFWHCVGIILTFVCSHFAFWALYSGFPHGSTCCASWSKPEGSSAGTVASRGFPKMQHSRLPPQAWRAPASHSWQFGTPCAGSSKHSGRVFAKCHGPKGKHGSAIHWLRHGRGRCQQIQKSLFGHFAPHRGRDQCWWSQACAPKEFHTSTDWSLLSCCFDSNTSGSTGPIGFPSPLCLLGKAQQRGSSLPCGFTCWQVLPVHAAEARASPCEWFGFTLVMQPWRLFLLRSILLLTIPYKTHGGAGSTSMVMGGK